MLKQTIGIEIFICRMCWAIGGPRFVHFSEGKRVKVDPLAPLA